MSRTCPELKTAPPLSTRPLPTLLLMPLSFLALWLLAAPQAQASDTQANSTLGKIEATGRIVLGHRQGARPFSFVEPDGTAQGYTIDLCLAVAEAVRSELQRPDLRVEFVPVTVDDRFERLLAGEIDLLCGSTTQTLERMTRMAFSSLTFVTGAALLTGMDSQVDGLSDLAGQAIGVIHDTTTETALEAALRDADLGVADREARIVHFDDHLSAIAAVEAGTIAAFAADRVILLGLLRSMAEPVRLRLTGGLFSHEPYALAMRPDDHRFRTLVNRTLSRIYSSPAIADIYERWFGSIGARPSDLLRSLYLLQTFPE